MNRRQRRATSRAIVKAVTKANAAALQRRTDIDPEVRKRLARGVRVKIGDEAPPPLQPGESPFGKRALTDPPHG